MTNYIEWQVADRIIAGTTTKELGNMSIKGGDSNGLENRQTLSNQLNIDLNNFVAPHQTHTTNFQQVYLKDGGTNVFKIDDKLNDIDATYTRDNNLCLMSFHADCTPILLYSPDQDLICAIHSGWVGTVNQIVSKVVAHLITNEHCDPALMKAYIGPCISYEKFEVQQDVINKVQAMDFDTTTFYKQTDEIHYLVDNKGLNKQQLLNCNLKLENITVSPYCTIKDNDLFYSHRHDKDGNRSITFIAKK